MQAIGLKNRISLHSIDGSNLKIRGSHFPSEQGVTFVRAQRGHFPSEFPLKDCAHYRCALLDRWP